MVTPIAVLESFLRRVEADLGSSAAVRWPDADFDTTAQTEWLSPELLDSVPVPSRNNMTNDRWLFQIGCHVRTDVDASIWRTWALADLVLDAFGKRDLAVRDYDAVGEPILGWLRFDDGTAEEIGQIAATGRGEIGVDVTTVVVTLSGAVIA